MTSTTDTAVRITEPGVYALPADVYLADPVPGGSLSSSGARLLLPPSCPALFHHWRTEGQPPKAAFDFGHAAHKLVLGIGPELVVINADDWRTKAARAERDEAYTVGAVPLLSEEYERVTAMAEALRRHPIASRLLQPGTGQPEQSLFWRDPPTGVWRRARLDWLPKPGAGRLIIPDYKTTNSAAPDDITKAMHSYGYHQQAAFYLDGVHALNLATGDAAFVLIFQEKTPPYLITVAEPTWLALQIGDSLNRRAIDLYAQCAAADNWPGHTEQVEPIGLPAWVERQYEGATW